MAQSLKRALCFADTESDAKESLFQKKLSARWKVTTQKGGPAGSCSASGTGNTSISSDTERPACFP